MNEKKLHIASWVLVGLLLLPMLQQVTGIFHERKLKGAVTEAEYPTWSCEDYFSGSFQDEVGEALNDRTGFRPFFIRLNNQLTFSLFGKAKASGVIIGKDNYMYEMNYILASQGQDYIGDSIIQVRAERLKTIQDYLDSLDKHMVVTFAAGKGSFYPEYFPDRLKVTKTKTNLEAYKAQFDSLGLNYIDFNDWFLQIKDTSQYILYPRTGVHWSFYGMVLVVDSLSNYLQKATGQPFPEFEYGDIKLSRRYKSTDADIEEGMNMLFRVNRDKMAYPKVAYHDEGYDKIKSVVIADSFYWGLHNLGFSRRMFDNGEFWYYYNRIYGTEEVIKIDTIDAFARLKETDVLILMATEATLKRFPFGFVEEIYPKIKADAISEPVSP